MPQRTRSTAVYNNISSDREWVFDVYSLIETELKCLTGRQLQLVRVGLRRTVTVAVFAPFTNTLTCLLSC